MNPYSITSVINSVYVYSYPFFTRSPRFSWNPLADDYDRVLFVTNASKEEFPPMNKLEGGIRDTTITTTAKRDGATDVVTLTMGDEIFFSRTLLITRQLKQGSLVSFEGYNEDNTLNRGISFYRGEVTGIDIFNWIITINPRKKRVLDMVHT